MVFGGCNVDGVSRAELLSFLAVWGDAVGGFDKRVVLVGGAAMCCYGLREKCSLDVDVVGDGCVVSEGRSVASSLGFPDGFVNTAVSGFIPFSLSVVDGPFGVGLASLEDLLCLKLVSWRDKDVPDIVALWNALGLDVSDECFSIVEGWLLERFGQGDDVLYGGVGDVMLSVRSFVPGLICD